MPAEMATPTAVMETATGVNGRTEIGTQFKDPKAEFPIGINFSAPRRDKESNETEAQLVVSEPVNLTGLARWTLQHLEVSRGTARVAWKAHNVQGIRVRIEVAAAQAREAIAAAVSAVAASEAAGAALGVAADAGVR